MPMKTSERLRQALLKHHELGMGYQAAYIGRAWYLVFNAQVALPIQLQLDSERADPGQLSRPLSEWLKEDDFRWLNSWAELAAPQNGEEEPATPQQGAIEALDKLSGSVSCVQTHGSYASASRPSEIFVRYSAFNPDFRISRNGSVRQGTYVTTVTDMPHVPSGLAAVGRYALPNPAPALYIYTMSPPSVVGLQCGTATPKFGQAGGGVEVLFTAALPAGTARGPNVIPER